MTSWVCVVVRRKVISGIGLGSSITGTGGDAAFSAWILSFFFRKSLSVMVVQLRVLREAMGTVCGLFKECNATECLYLYLLDCINNKGRGIVKEKRSIVHASLAAACSASKVGDVTSRNFQVLAASCSFTL